MNLRHILNLCLLLGCVLLTGCATKGGWPCWSWQKNTDQKNQTYGEKLLKEQSSIMPTDAPVAASPIMQSAAVIVPPPTARTAHVGWECHENYYYAFSDFYTGVDMADRLDNPNWITVAGFPANATNEATVIYYTPNVFFRAWTCETNRF